LLFDRSTVDEAPAERAILDAAQRVAHLLQHIRVVLGFGKLLRRHFVRDARVADVVRRIDELSTGFVRFLADPSGQSFLEIEKALLIVLNVHDSPLLLVSLDDGGRANLGLIRILTELAPRVSLPQQIPTLIELDLDGFQPYLIVIGQFALPVEMLFFVNETLDFFQNGVIGRRFSHDNHLADSRLSQ
jgi:hypothetical protein